MIRNFSVEQQNHLVCFVQKNLEQISDISLHHPHVQAKITKLPYYLELITRATFKMLRVVISALFAFTANAVRYTVWTHGPNGPIYINQIDAENHGKLQKKIEADLDGPVVLVGYDGWVPLNPDAVDVQYHPQF